MAGGLAAAFQYEVVPFAILGVVSGALIGTFFLSESFIRIVLPLSLPGVFAGSLLTFIPAMGDYVNAELLGNPQTRMIGNVIQSRFLTNNDYPTAAALSLHPHGRDPGRRGGLRAGPRHRGADERRR